MVEGWTPLVVGDVTFELMSIEMGAQLEWLRVRARAPISLFVATLRWAKPAPMFTAPAIDLQRHAGMRYGRCRIHENSAPCAPCRGAGVFHTAHLVARCLSSSRWLKKAPFATTGQDGHRPPGWRIGDFQPNISVGKLLYPDAGMRAGLPPDQRSVSMMMVMNNGT